METIISGVIAGGVTLIVCVINNIFQARATRNLIEYKLEELQKKVDKHNSVIDRTYKLEKIAEVQEEKIKVANNRIKDLESDQKEWDGIDRRKK